MNIIHTNQHDEINKNKSHTHKHTHTQRRDRNKINDNIINCLRQVEVLGPKCSRVEHLNIHTNQHDEINKNKSHTNKQTHTHTSKKMTRNKLNDQEPTHKHYKHLNNLNIILNKHTHTCKQNKT